MSWADLPVDIIRLVACRLPCIVDFQRVRAVCRLWRESLDVQHHFVPLHPPPIHVYVLPRWDSTLAIYRPMTDSESRIICYYMEGVDVIGSGCGWIVVEDGVRLRMISILPPARLPLPGRDGFQSDLFPTDVVDTRLRKIVVVHASSVPGDFAALAIFHSQARLAFARPRDTVWTTICTFFDAYVDVTVDEDGGLFAVTRTGHVVTYRLFGLFGVGVPGRRGVLINPPSALDLNFSMCRCYILTLGDRIYVIFRQFDVAGRTTQFLIRAIGLHGLMDVDGLQGHAIFVGEMTSSISISTVDFPQLVPNRIWFSDDRFRDAPRDFLDVGFCDTPAGHPIYDMTCADLPIPPHFEHPVWNLLYPY